MDFDFTEESDVDPLIEAGQNSLIAYAQLVKPNYKPGRHHYLIARELEKVAFGKTKRLMIFAPPRHGKTELATQIFPAWYGGLYSGNDEAFPGATPGGMIFGYNQDKANDFGREILGYMQTKEHRQIFPNAAIKQDREAIASFETVNKFKYFCTGQGGSCTGRGGTILVGDDPYKNRQDADSGVFKKTFEEWFTSTWRTRLEGDGAMVLIFTRWNYDDIGKFLLDRDIEEDIEEFYRWKVLKLNALIESEEEAAVDPLQRKLGEALWPEKYSAKILLQIKKEVGPRDWRALYKQDPTAKEGDVFQRSWFHFYRKEELKTWEVEKEASSWDMGFAKTETSDFTVGLEGSLVLIGEERKLALTHRTKGRMNFTDAKKAMVSRAVLNPMISQWYVENKANGPAIITDLNGVIYGLTPVNPEEVGSKDSRHQAAATHVEAGKVLLPQGEHWVEDFLDCICQVPNGQYDDDADALSQFVIKEFGVPNLDALLKYYELMAKKDGAGDELQKEQALMAKAELKMEEEEKNLLEELAKKDPEVKNEFFGMV